MSIGAQAALGESLALDRARLEVGRIRNLVDAGAMPKAALDRAKSDLADAEDESIVGQTLYGTASVEDLTNDQAAEMVRAAERQVDRQQAKIDERQKLVDEGVLARTELTSMLEELDRRKRTLDLARSRVRLLEELSKMVQVEQQQLDPIPQNPTPLAQRYDGSGIFTNRDFKRISTAFERRFGHSLPVSAMGMTALHRALGFDHTGRVDVALNPDQEEGRWLRTYLEQSRIPYFAFRAAVPGSATGAHIHLGPPSLRLASVVAHRPRTQSAQRIAD